MPARSVLRKLIPAGILMFLGIEIWSLLIYGNILDGPAALAGYSLIARNSVIDLGQLDVGKQVSAEIDVVNLTDAPIRILGADTGCPCAVTSGLPMTIPPRSTKAITVLLTPAAGDAGTELTRPIEIFSDTMTDGIRVVLKGSVRPPDSQR